VKIVEIKPPKIARGRRDRSVLPAVAFCGVVVLAGGAWLGLQVAGPLQVAAKLHSENDAIERQLRAKEIQNQTAQKALSAIRTDQGAIDAARSKGYMFPTERPLHVQSEHKP